MILELLARQHERLAAARRVDPSIRLAWLKVGTRVWFLPAQKD